MSHRKQPATTDYRAEQGNFTGVALTDDAWLLILKGGFGVGTSPMPSSFMYWLGFRLLALANVQESREAATAEQAAADLAAIVETAGNA